MRNISLKSFRQIEADYIVEVLVERFSFFPVDVLDSGLALSMIYGGALRDAVAGLPLEGDLDIAVATGPAFSQIVGDFESSSKWSRVFKGSSVPMGKSMPRHRRNKAAKIELNDELLVPVPPTVFKDAHKKYFYGGVEVAHAFPSSYGNVPLSQIITFEDASGALVDIIHAKDDNASRNAAIFLVSSVDLICCGFAMGQDGSLFEIVEGAEEDCKNRILRINTSVLADLNLERVKERISRFEKRGWKSEIDLKKLTEKHRKLQSSKRPKRHKSQNIAAPKMKNSGTVWYSATSAPQFRTARTDALFSKTDALFSKEELAEPDKPMKEKTKPDPSDPHTATKIRKAVKKAVGNIGGYILPDGRGYISPDAPVYYSSGGPHPKKIQNPENNVEMQIQRLLAVKADLEEKINDFDMLGPSLVRTVEENKREKEELFNVCAELSLLERKAEKLKKFSDAYSQTFTFPKYRYDAGTFSTSADTSDAPLSKDEHSSSFENKFIPDDIAGYSYNRVEGEELFTEDEFIGKEISKENSPEVQTEPGIEKKHREESNGNDD